MKKQLGAGALVVQILAPLLLLASTFPYVQIVPSSGYTQPYALIFGLILFVFCFGIIFQWRKYDQIAIVGLGFIGVMLFIITCLPYDNFHEYQYLLTYLSPLLMVPGFVAVIQQKTKQTILILQGSVVIWLFVSIIQLLINPEFATSFLGEWGDSATDIILSGRGVLGLAPEPTHNAFHTLLLGAALALLDSSKISRFLVFSCIVSAVVLAASSSAALILLASTLIWLLRYKTLWGIALVVVGLSFLAVLSSLLQLMVDTDSRLINLMKEVIQDPTTFLVIDHSVNMRLGGLWAVLSDSIRSGLQPHGLSHDTWLQARTEILKTYDWLLDLSLTGPPSGFGLLLFQGGILVLPFLFMFIHRLFVSQPRNLLGQIILIAVPLIFLSQFYISAPLFSMIYACALYRQRLNDVAVQQAYPTRSLNLNS